MDKSYWKQCGRKKRYRDEHTANYYRKLFERERGTKLDYYWCGHCRGFHLTSVILEEAIPIWIYKETMSDREMALKAR